MGEIKKFPRPSKKEDNRIRISIEAYDKKFAEFFTGFICSLLALITGSIAISVFSENLPLGGIHTIYIMMGIATLSLAFYGISLIYLIHIADRQETYRFVSTIPWHKKFKH